ncbi:hypothetical protein [Streptomyces erythrochromogenes]|uniref:hypothetical protein n=1 Tax=Streptomyces erythrochromogenes TaxID=285574 RepID=UPI003424E827
MYDTVFEIITLVLVVVGTTACAVHKRSVTRQVNALRAEVACARIEGVLGKQPRAGEKPAVPAPARGQR